MQAFHHAVKTLLAFSVILPYATQAADDASLADQVTALPVSSAFANAQDERANASATDGISLFPDEAEEFGPAVDIAKLGSHRGGSEVITEVINKMTVNGNVNNNIAVNVATGINAINDGAFANASGIPTVIQNSGANVLIQNAMILNLRFE